MRDTESEGEKGSYIWRKKGVNTYTRETEKRRHIGIESR